MYREIADGLIAAQKQKALDALPQELQQPAVDIMASVSPAIEQVAKVAFHNGMEVARQESRQAIDIAKAQASKSENKLRYLYQHSSVATQVEIGLLLNDFNNKNNN